MQFHVGGERTTITPTPQALQFLAARHVEVSACGGATLASDGALVLPILSGTVTAQPMNGVIRHQGCVVFKHEGRKLVFKDFVLKRDHDRAVLTAIVGGDDPILFARVDRFAVQSVGDEAVVTGRLRLGAEAAQRFNKLLSPGAVAPGTELGNLKSILRFT
jgi:hypothetical protein